MLCNQQLFTMNNNFCPSLSSSWFVFVIRPCIEDPSKVSYAIECDWRGSIMKIAYFAENFFLFYGSSITLRSIDTGIAGLPVGSVLLSSFLSQ